MTDRRALLGDASPQELAELFRRVPALDAVVARPGGQRVPVGGWTGEFRAVTSPRNLDELAEVLADRSIVVATLLEATSAQLQLVQLVSWHGGSLSYQQVVDEAGEEAAAELDADADVLTQLLLGHRRSTWLTLFPGVDEVIETEGSSLRPGLDALNSDVIGAMLRNLGHRKPPTRKAERIELLVRHLRDPAALRATIDGLPGPARAMFHQLLEDHPRSTYELDPAYRRRYSSYGGRTPATSPLQVLEDHGLVRLGVYGSEVHVWTDVEVALRGRLFETWPQPPALEPVPLDPTVPALPPIVATFDRLLALWAATPAEGLASGGIGVRAVKAAAKTLGVASTTVATLAAMAVQLGLLGTVTLVPAARRGRGWTPAKDGWAPTPLRAEWQQLHPALRWSHLVHAWRDARLLDESDGLPNRVVASDELSSVAEARRRVLDVLVELPEDTGVDAATLARHLSLRHPFHVDDEVAPGIIAVLRLLGLVAEQGPVGLTPLGRQVLTAPASVAEVLGAGADSFIVQPDLTIIAPPDLEAGLLARLDDYAICESAAGARIYRLDEARLALALDAGASAETIVAFLADHSSVELPATVERLVGDVARRHGTLRAGAATSYLVSEDPALLGRAVAVRPAKLRALAPTVAVSTLASDKLVEVLRGKGLMPVAEGEGGEAVRLEDHAGEPVLATDHLPSLEAPTDDTTRMLRRARALVRG